MSASREKKARQEQMTSGYVDPKVLREQEEKAKNRRSNLLYAGIAVVFVIVAAIAVISNTKVLERGADAVTVGSETYTAADVDYFYYTIYNNFVSNNYYYLSYYGLDTSTSLKEQECMLGAEGTTWYDYFLDAALENLKSYALLAQKAEAEGFDADDYVEESVASTFADLDTYASENGYTRSQYINAICGSLVNEKVFERNVRMIALAEAYADSYADSLSFSADEVQAEYDANPKDYQSVDIEYILFTSSYESDATDEEKEAALAEAKTKAETALSRYDAGESFEAISEDMEGTYNHSANSSNGTSEMLTWAFDEARTEGDTTVAAYSTTGYYAVLFHSRSRNDYHSVSVRHILVSDEDKANEILDTYNAGEKTEDAFAALAVENSTDSNASSGGLYSNIYKGQMVASFENWCFDEARQSGDVEIVETSYGYHVMYFVETNEQPYWYYSADLSLKNDAYNEWYSGITESVEAEQLDGIKYVG